MAILRMPPLLNRLSHPLSFSFSSSSSSHSGIQYEMCVVPFLSPSSAVPRRTQHRRGRLLVLELRRELSRHISERRNALRRSLNERG